MTLTNIPTESINTVTNPRYVILENGIPYDWDDYDLWGAVLYDIANETIVTTKYGHGTGMSVDGQTIELDDAISNSVVTINKLIEVMINSLPTNVNDAIYNVACNHNLDNPLGIPVKVIHGRKAKGVNGYLVYGIAAPVRYGLGAYHNEYNHYPIIYNPADDTFTKVNSFGYLEYTDDMLTNSKAVIFEKVDKTIKEVRRLAHAWAYNMSYSACDSDNYRYLCASYAKLAIPTIVPDVVLKGIANRKAQLAAAEEAKMNEKLPKIIEWVKANTDKTTEEDILALAKHIYHKYN